jgi:ABC-type antimicrobial peptide transport system permease subunit
LGHFVRTELFGIQPSNPAAIIVPALLLTAIALLAGFIPARRAASSDPVQVLRYE